MTLDAIVIYDCFSFLANNVFYVFVQNIRNEKIEYLLFSRTLLDLCILPGFFLNSSRILRVFRQRIFRKIKKECVLLIVSNSSSVFIKSNRFEEQCFGRSKQLKRSRRHQKLNLECKIKTARQRRE